MTAPLLPPAPSRIASSGARFSGPLFITGMWRCGSSLLYALLNRHPQVGLMYEADVALLRPAFWKPRGAGWAERWDFWNRGVQRHGLDRQALEPPTAAGGGRGKLAHAIALAGREYARRKGALIWGDKSPDLYDRLTYLARLFPEARFVIVWRNPLDTSSSMAAAAEMGASFFRKRGMALRGLLGVAELRRQADALRAGGRLVCEVSYEDLVQDPANVLRRVCEFIEVPFDERLVDLEGADRSALHSADHHANLRGNRIVSGPRPGLVDDALRRKIGRYLNWWRLGRDPGWPAYPPAAGKDTELPRLRERVRDRVAYRGCRALDVFTRAAFCLAPLSWLRWYRRRKAGA